MRETNGEKVQKILALAKDFASRHTDEGLDKAADILLSVIHGGSQDPELLVTAASYLLQGSQMSKIEIKKEAIALVDKAVALDPDVIPILEGAIQCYDLALNDFPEKLDEIIRLCLKVLDLDPEHIDCMITLATHRQHPSVALSLKDAIRMLEWGLETDPTNTGAAVTLTSLYSEAGQYEKARKLYQQFPDNSNLDSPEGLDAPNGEKFRKVKNQGNRYRKYGKN